MCFAEFQEKYIELHQLGEGGFGFVFAGYRDEDKLPVSVTNTHAHTNKLSQFNDFFKSLRVRDCRKLQNSSEGWKANS